MSWSNSTDFLIIFFKILCRITTNNGDEDYTEVNSQWQCQENYNLWETTDTWFTCWNLRRSWVFSTNSPSSMRILIFPSMPVNLTDITDLPPWPDTFEIPYFPVDIECRLRHGNLLYVRDNSIKFKMGNYCSKLRRVGCRDVAVNQGKRKGQSPKRSIKRPFFYPESKPKELAEEMKKCHPTDSLITKNMDSTFAMRRQELVNLEDTMERWPALFTEGSGNLKCFLSFMH